MSSEKQEQLGINNNGGEDSESCESENLGNIIRNEIALQSEAEDSLAPLGLGGHVHDDDFLVAQLECLRTKALRPEMFVSGYDADDQGIVPPADPNAPGERLLQAAEHGKLQVVKDLISTYPDILAYQDNDGYGALHRAAYSEHPEIIKFLLSKGFPLEKVTDDGWTALHCASHWNSSKCVRELVNSNSNVNAKTNSGQTPLHVACNEQAREAMIILLTCPNIDISIRNSNGDSSHDIARRAGRHAHLFELCHESINKLS